MAYNETIVAIATSLANGAISIIKVSGDDSIEIVNECFKGSNLKKAKSHTIHHGYIVDNNEVLDEVLVSIFIAPKTFTKENVVEINCHGGIFVTNKVLELLLRKGARLAEPGEFTKRAFLNGRIDLTQAEAVMDVIEAQTTSSLKMANFGLLGETKALIESFRTKVLNCMLEVEVNIDYPEYEDEKQINNDILKPTIIDLINDIDVVLKKSETSKILKNGIRTAIIGKPNVGKSSLLNSLLREEKAIVTDIAGTTRDLIEGSINIGGVVLDLIDTAGVHDTIDKVEQIGVNKTKQAIKEASLIILVFDNNKNLDENDHELLELTSDKKRVIVINKKDLESKIDLDILKDYILVSSFDKNDISKLENKIKEICSLNDIKQLDATYIGNARQIALLKLAKENLEDALKSIDNDNPIDITNIDINNAWKNLGEIIGACDADELINTLFSRFCLGK